MPQKVFFSVDGDDVGKLIEKGLLENDELFLTQTSSQIKQWLLAIENIIIKYDGKVIMSGGDMLLSIINNDCIKSLLKDLSKVQTSFKFTCSAAVGRTMPEVYFALKLAKSKGKNHIVNLVDENFQPISDSKIVMP